MKAETEIDIRTFILMAALSHSSQNIAFQVSNNGWMQKKKCDTCTYHVVVFSLKKKKEGNYGTWYNMDEPWRLKCQVK